MVGVAPAHAHTGEQTQWWEALVEAVGMEAELPITQ